jgi:hypothetical protein
MERSAIAVRMTEAIPTPVRVAGWTVIIVPLFAFLVDGPDQNGPLRTFLGQILSILGLGAGIAPLEFLALAWVAVALVFWAQAFVRGQTLGRKSTLVFVTALLTQGMLLLLANPTT